MAPPVPSRPRTLTRKTRLTPARERKTSTSWPTIEKFLDSGEGQITLGAIPYSSLHHTAIASDGHNMLVALVRRRGETLHKLLSRLDKALLRALEEQIYVDEIN